MSETIANLSPRALEMVTDAAVTGNVKNSTELLSYVVKMPGATQYVYDKAVAFCDPYVNAQHPENYEKEQAYIYKDPVSEKEKMVEKIDLSSLAKACNEETRTSREVEKEEFGISDFAVNEDELRDTETAVFDPEIIGSKSEMEEDREIESDERDMDYEETL